MSQEYRTVSLTDSENVEIGTPLRAINFDSWGCELCRGAKFVSGIAYSEKEESHNGVQAVSFSDEGADCDFEYCPYCGRPLTEKAKAELKNKLCGCSI